MKQAKVAASFFEPTAVAIVGASEEAGRIGSGLYESITQSFTGQVFCVNPKYSTLWNSQCYDSVLALPTPVSHAVIAVAARLVPDCVQQCIEAGIPHVVVVSAGFKETDSVGAAMERELADLCQAHGTTLLGPNTLGFINAQLDYNGTFLPDQFKKGSVSVISQSGGVGMALLAALKDQYCGISKWVGIGNEAVLDATDFLEYFADDPQTSVIAVCFEGLQNLPRFFRAAEKVSRKKPIVLLQDGRSATGMQAAMSHTGTMAQNSSVMRGSIRQCGLLEATGCHECAVMLKALSVAPHCGGNRAILLSNTAGPAIMAADAMDAAGVRLPIPSPKLRQQIDDEAGIALGLKNPADISSNGLQPRNYEIAARQLLQSDEYDILLAFFSLNRHLVLPDAEIAAVHQKTAKPVVACFLGSYAEFSAYDRKIEQAGIPCYCDPQDAAVALGAIVQYSQLCRRKPRQVQRVLRADEAQAAADYLQQLSPDTAVLCQAEAQQFLQLAGMPVNVPIVCATADEVAAAAVGRYPVVLKVHSKKILHKTDVGGVRLNLQDEAALHEAVAQMQPAMKRLDEESLLTVEPAAAAGFEMILGAVRLPGFGPVIMAGTGGIYTEVYQDIAFRLVPVDQTDVSDLLGTLQCAPILDGFRGQTLDKAPVQSILLRLAQLMELFPQLREIEINPCRVYEKGAEILDARIGLSQSFPNSKALDKR